MRGKISAKQDQMQGKMNCKAHNQSKKLSTVTGLCYMAMTV